MRYINLRFAYLLNLCPHGITAIATTLAVTTILTVTILINYYHSTAIST